MTLHNQLNTLESTGLVRLISAQPNVEYIFRHALIHDAVHDSIVKRDRIELHTLVGSTLEQLYPDRLNAPDLAPLLAYHFDLGQDYRRAIKYYTLSGDAAYDAFANREAIDHYTRAIELAGHAEVSSFQIMHLYARRGRARELTGQYAEALTEYRELESVARRRNDRSMELQALILQATVLSAPTSVRNHEQGEAISARAMSMARDLNDRAAEAKILWTFLMLHRHSGDLKQALEYGQQAATLAREYHLNEQLAYVLNDLEPVYMLFGRLEEASATLLEAQQIWRDIQNLPMLADSLSTEALMNFFAGKYDRVLQVSQEAQQLSERIGNLWNQSYSRYGVGYVYLDHGEIDRAIEVMQAVIDYGRQAGFLFALLQTQSDLGYVYTILGDYDRALDCASKALTTAQEVFPQGTGYPLGLFGYIHAVRGHLDEAENYLRQAHIDYSANELSMMSYFTPMADVEVALARREYERANQIADQAINLLNQYGMQPFRQDALYFKALALVRLNRTEEALPFLEQAAQVALSLNSVRKLWEIYALQAEVEQTRGNQLEAFKLRAQAREYIHTIAAHIGSPDLRASFLNLPKVRQVSDAA